MFFCNSGAEAVEAAIKLARKARPGGEIVVVHGAFHGRTYGALSATPQEAKQAPFAPLVPGFRAVAPTADALSAAVDERTAAVLLEPIQGETRRARALRRAARGRARGVRRARRGADLRRDPDAASAAPARCGPTSRPASCRTPHQRQGARRRPADRRADHRAAARRRVRARRPRLDVRRRARSSPPPRTLRSTSSTTRRCSRACASSASGCARGLERLPHVLGVRGRGLMLAGEVDVPAPGSCAARCSSSAWSSTRPGRRPCGCCRR